MDIILAVCIVFILAAIVNSVSTEANKTSTTTITKKQCPPHQWHWQEIKDQQGETQGHRIVCKVCGPLSKSLEGSIE